MGKRSKKGVFITTSSFSKEAVEYVSSIDAKIVLIDGKRLAELMIDYDVGVTTVTTYQLKRVDSDYFGNG
jgi:restriction system protein